MKIAPLLASLAVLPSTVAAADELPAEARSVVTTFERTATGIRDRAEKEIQPHREKAVAQLQTIQDALCRAGKLDEAVAVRDQIRTLLGIRPDPGALHVSAEDIGKTFLYLVTGATDGSVWGTEVYTSDSHLGTAAVHLGVVEPGQKAVVRVRVVPGQSSFSGTTRNRVTSASYGSWPVAFTVERARGQ